MGTAGRLTAAAGASVSDAPGFLPALEAGRTLTFRHPKHYWPVFLAASLSDAHADAPLPVAGDAFSALTASPQMPGRFTVQTDDPVARAFAAADAATTLPSEDDRAAILAFATMRTQASAPRPSAASAAATRQPQPSGAGIVLAPDGVPSYSADQDAMRGLITTPAAYDPQLARLAMPVPSQSAPELFQAPQAAADVSVLGADPDLPVDHFETAESREAPDERGFFIRLFASLIE